MTVYVKDTIESLKRNNLKQEIEISQLREIINQMLKHRVWPYSDKALKEKMWIDRGYMLTEDQICSLFDITKEDLAIENEKKIKFNAIAFNGKNLYFYSSIVSYINKLIKKYEKEIFDEINL